MDESEGYSWAIWVVSFSVSLGGGSWCLTGHGDFDPHAAAGLGAGLLRVRELHRGAGADSAGCDPGDPRGFLAAGADVVETDTFGANQLVLGESGLTAGDVRAEQAGRGGGPGGVRPVFDEGAAAVCGGVDRAGDEAHHPGEHGLGDDVRQLPRAGPGPAGRRRGRAHDRDVPGPAAGQVRHQRGAWPRSPRSGKTAATCRSWPRSRSRRPGRCCWGRRSRRRPRRWREYPICSLGLNCATGPTEMAEHIHWLGKHWAGDGEEERARRFGHAQRRPAGPGGGPDRVPAEPGPFAEAMLQFVERDGVDIVGGCCGTMPEHIRLLSAGGRDRPGSATPGHPIAKPSRPASRRSTPSTDYRQDNSIPDRRRADEHLRLAAVQEAARGGGLGRHGLAWRASRCGRRLARAGPQRRLRRAATTPRDMREIVKRVVRQVQRPADARHDADARRWRRA